MSQDSKATDTPEPVSSGSRSDWEALGVELDACDHHQGACPTPRQLRQADMAKAWAEGFKHARFEHDCDQVGVLADNPYRLAATR